MTLPKGLVDLHLHSARSDGRYPFDDVLRRVVAAGVSTVAVTDHDLPPAACVGVQEIDGRTVRLIGATELSGMWRGRELHLLVYVPGAIPEVLAAFCAGQARARAARYEAARVRLEAAVGAALPPADDDALTGARALTRFHLARAIVISGRAASVREAFDRWLGDDAGLVPPLETTFLEAIALAKHAGALTSWAHPPAAAVERWLPEFAAAGLDALEVSRPRLPAAERKALKRAARRWGLLETGGSDWHGWQGEPEYGLFQLRAAEVAPFLAALDAAR
jgi:predicted metal-dependent phosphoesterase TrpH